MKAAIILEEIPENCEQCDFSRLPSWLDIALPYCLADFLNRDVNRFDKPEWCPIVEIDSET